MSGKNRITYYPPATQRLLRHNAAQIADKPYAKYFDPDLWLHDEVMPAIARPMPREAALAPLAKDLNSLLDAGYHEVENGYCELEDGSGYTASLVPMPGCTGEMYKWWFWWHAVEPARYTLWYPTNHIAAHPVDRSVLTAPGLSHEQRYVGTTHHVDEYIGSELVHVAISFVDPAEFGFDVARFEAAGIVGHACARVSLRVPFSRAPGFEVESVTMVHLARETADGIEQRSRYWIGHDTKVRALNQSISVDWLGAKLGIKRRLAGASMAYEQLLHDQIEFTHLATFLPRLHAEFGAAP